MKQNDQNEYSSIHKKFRSPIFLEGPPPPMLSSQKSYPGCLEVPVSPALLILSCGRWGTTCTSGISNGSDGFRQSCKEILVLDHSVKQEWTALSLTKSYAGCLEVPVSSALLILSCSGGQLLDLEFQMEAMVELQGSFLSCS